jgi:hypothetical protein
LPEVEFENKSFTETIDNWSDANIVVCNTTCFEEDAMTELEECLTGLAKNTFLIILSKKIDEKQMNWELLKTEKHEMSWGVSTFHIYRKIT